MAVIELPCLEYAEDTVFPPTSQALDDPNGLLAWGGSLSAERLVSAYEKGIFPWYSENEPILWWSPSPRCVLYPDRVYVASRTRRRLRQAQFQVKADTAFSDVIAACAAPGPGRTSTWITDEMIAAYSSLHELGIAHSVEVWVENELVGGVYGLALGHMFFGESMFSRQPDASKIALIHLCRQLEAWGFGPMDCQVGNEHLYRMGAVDIDREEFEETLAKYTSRPRENGSWQNQFQPHSER